MLGFMCILVIEVYTSDSNKILNFSILKLSLNYIISKSKIPGSHPQNKKSWTEMKETYDIPSSLLE